MMFVADTLEWYHSAGLWFDNGGCMYFISLERKNGVGGGGEKRERRERERERGGGKRE